MTARPQNTAPGEVHLALSERSQVATIVVDRPEKLNALTLALLDRLHEVALGLADSSARVVVIRTAGDRVFSVGADITHFAGLDSVAMWRTWIATGHRAFDAIASLKQPTIAVIDGLAYGGGLELALAADFRVIASEARIALPETGLGTVPGWGGTERVTELVGRARAKELVLARRVLTGAEALDWGLATRCADRAELEASVLELQGELLGGGPIAVQLAKQIIDAAANGAPSSLLEALAGALTATTDDLAEGIAAFHDKRPPVFLDH